MKISQLILILVLPAMGCQSLKRITEGASSTPPASEAPLANDYYLEGVVNVEFAIVDLPTVGRQITVGVKKPGEERFHMLYEREYSLHVAEKGYIAFSRSYVQDEQGWHYQGHPVAPIGSSYRIHSTLKQKEENIPDSFSY